MAAKVQVVFYSMYGHVYRLAEAVAEGARKVKGVEVELLQVAETLPQEVLEKMGAIEAKKAFEHVPIADPDHLAEADAFIFGSPTRFGNMAAQMRAFFDQTGGLWFRHALVGKVGSVFTSTGTGGGNESTIMSFLPTLIHHGMIYVGLPYTCPELTDLTAPKGGSAWGSATIAGHDGSRQPTPQELSQSRFQGHHVAQIAVKLARK